MFHFKDILNRVAHGPSPPSPARNNEPDTTEGFLCPQCMNAFSSQEELQIHYSASHKDTEPPLGSPNSNNEDVSVFQSFHQGVGDRYKQVSVSSGEEAVEAADSILLDNQGELSPELTIKDLMKKLKDLIKQNELIAEEKKQVEQRAAALAEKVVTLKATADEGESEMAALTKRLALVEAQLAHRENIDDAAVLRQELIQVQRVMDEMTREREMESDQLKRDLQNLQQKYDALESESAKAKSVEEDMKRVAILEEELEKKEELFRKLSDEKIVLKGAVNTLESELFQNCSKLKEAESSLENLRLVLNETQLSAEKYKEKVTDLEKRLHEASLELEESKNEQAQLRETVKHLENDNAKEKKVILDLQSEISSHLNVISEKNQELMTVNGKVEVLTSQLKDYAISNEDLRSHNAEQARYLEDKMKLVASMEDKEKEIKNTLEENAAQMGLLNKNYLELMNLFQAQMHNNSKMEPEIEKKLLGQIESAVDILKKKSSELENSSNDKQMLEKLQKDGERMNEEQMIAQLQSQCNEKAEKLIEAQRRITILSTEIESKAITEKAKAEEYEAIISSLRFNLQTNNDELFAKNKIVKDLEDQLATEKLLVAKKDGELSELNAKYLLKAKEIAAVKNVFIMLKKDHELCKIDVLKFLKEFKHVNQACREKMNIIAALQENLERDSKELVVMKEELKRVYGVVKDKDTAIEDLEKKLDTEQKKNSDLQDLNSIKSMEVDELNSTLTVEKQKCCQLESTLEELRLSNSKLKEDLQECEDKVRCLTADLLACEKLRADLETKNKELEEKLQAEISDKEMCIETYEGEKKLLVEQNAEIKEKLEELEMKHKADMEKGCEEMNQLKIKLSKEEKLREEVTKNLEEEMLAKAALEKEFSQSKSRYEEDLRWLNNNISELKIEINTAEEEKKVKEQTIDKLRENISAMQLEWETERQALLERYIQSTKETENLHSTNNDLRRRLEDSQAALHEIGRENQTYQMEIAKLSGRKWTEDADATNCAKCAKEFSIRVRKHHCRNCGQIFCNDCSMKTAAIASNKKPVRVCDPCYFELVPN
ncbi:early endosome antigen 1-like [Ischnura elegans]|uniref:early endosome antigen 1-like n=1 Tax=Ischnura elegans TaxID=197161 RepID=UPI001ED88894|nr:early endosome antigen 1-like [Ischnura elegans]